MTETHIDSTSAGFAGKIDGKPLRYRIAIFFNGTILVPFIIFACFMYSNYLFLTNPDILSFPMILGFVISITAQILTVLLLKIISGDEIAQIMREIFR